LDSLEDYKKIKKACVNCGEMTSNIKFCSYDCNSEFQIKESFSNIEKGEGLVTISAEEWHEKYRI
jgi:hypothetical protein